MNIFKVKNILIMLLILIVIMCIFSINNLTINNKIILDEITNEEEYKNVMAIMIEEKNPDGTSFYKESTDKKWPKLMLFNSNKSKCLDKNGNKLEGALSYNSESRIATVNTTTTSYCYLYFDIDDEPPINNSVIINNNDAHTQNTNVTLSLGSTGATEMCISNTTSCTNYIPYETSKNHVLSSGFGTKNVYVYYRDVVGNTSEVVFDTILFGEIINTVPSQSGNLTYTGGSQSPSWNNYDSNKLTISGTTNGVNAGSYTVTFTPISNYMWSDQTQTPKTVTWTIGKATISVIPGQSGSLTYTGSSQSPSWNNYDSNKLTIGGTTNGTNAGSYNATFTPKTNYMWSDGSQSVKTVTWNIAKTKINSIPSQSGSLTYTGSSQSPSWNNYDSNKLTIGGTTNGTNAGSYNVTFTPKSNYMWSDGTQNAKTASWTIGKAKLNVPSQSGSLTYTGGSQSPSWNNYDSNKLTISGTTNGVNAGSYNATFTPKTNYMWSDGTQNAKTVTWSISKKAGSITLSSTGSSINYNTSTSFSVTSNLSGGSLSVTSSDSGIATVNLSGNTVAISGKISGGPATITVTSAATANYNAASATYVINVINPVGTYIKGLSPYGLNSSMEGGLYRFQGTSVNNYICFGTDIKSTCLSNTDAHMYRIIGINSSGQLKLIKNEAFNTSYTWHNSGNSKDNIVWPNSDLYKGLNGISGGSYNNLFIGNSTYTPGNWSDKIATMSWKYGDLDEDDASAAGIYSAESSWSSSVNAKIALMYAHDYYYAYQSGGLNCTLDSKTKTYELCRNAWIHILNCDSSPKHSYDIMLTRYINDILSSWTGTYYYNWYATDDGWINHHGISSNISVVRPVFYLTTSVNYVSGSGTSNDPFLIR